MIRIATPRQTVRATVLVMAVVLATLVLTMAIPASERALSVHPAEAAPAVKVTVRCASSPETTRVVNNTNHRITVKKLGSIHQPRSNEPFRVNRTLRRGKAITFESGSSANQNVLTRQFIYDNDVGRREGARVSTSVGRFVDRCG